MYFLLIKHPLFEITKRPETASQGSRYTRATHIPASPNQRKPTRLQLFNVETGNCTAPRRVATLVRNVNRQHPREKSRHAMCSVQFIILKFTLLKMYRNVKLTFSSIENQTSRSSFDFEFSSYYTNSEIVIF